MTGIDKVKNVIIVLSGKGGVGKSTVSCQLALSLAFLYGKSVGILDIDLCGPSVPKICGVEGRNVLRDENGLKPVSLVNGDSKETLVHPNLYVMSIGFLLSSENDAVVWRGPKKDAMIKQFLNEVNWQELDYLIIDTPPGTSDEHLTLCEVLRGKNDITIGAIIVTTPQDVSTDDVRKELSFCHKLRLRCLGIVENMSGYVCPHCSECSYIFSKGGGEKLSELYETPFLGSIPIDPQITSCEDQGKFFIECHTSNDMESIGVQPFRVVIDNILNQMIRLKEVISLQIKE